ncbi:hypothetical protein NP233_g6010 [Leucocoprinus birnbaumii]|uniref:Uncharacterized protein n=1 Tax=Leucocoprinus birnbaumii TaxID=56174 RepID=A0AAD5VUH5_9AGAR|nr:hypothetical protein NP233_g6010 [Leucocoprinus birnbaumii]
MLIPSTPPKPFLSSFSPLCPALFAPLSPRRPLALSPPPRFLSLAHARSIPYPSWSYHARHPDFQNQDIMKCVAARLSFNKVIHTRAETGIAAMAAWTANPLGSAPAYAPEPFSPVDADELETLSPPIRVGFTSLL